MPSSSGPRHWRASEPPVLEPPLAEPPTIEPSTMDPPGAARGALAAGRGRRPARGRLRPSGPAHRARFVDPGGAGAGRAGGGDQRHRGRSTGTVLPWQPGKARRPLDLSHPDRSHAANHGRCQGLAPRTGRCAAGQSAPGRLAHAGQSEPADLSPGTGGRGKHGRARETVASQIDRPSLGRLFRVRAADAGVSSGRRDRCAADGSGPRARHRG